MVDQPQRVVDATADEATTTVTLTVTEKGSAFRPGGYDLDPTHPVFVRLRQAGGDLLADLRTHLASQVTASMTPDLSSRV